jgi:uncharacterized protein (DUF58 family)
MSETTARYVDPRSLEALGSMQLRARAVVEGVVNGLHRNPHRGSSVEFAEYKEYRPGDDLRHIDWRAYGRVDRYYVKQFEDETNLRAWLLLDVSGSMDFAFEGAPTKRLWASTLLAALAWLLLRQGDAPGLLLFDEQPGAALAPSSKSTQLHDICAALERPAGGVKTSIATALARIAERVHRRSLVVLASDMLDSHDDMVTLLRVLRRRGLEVALFHVADRAEVELPWEGLTIFEGLEGEEALLAEPDELRAAYREEFEAHAARVRDECRRADVEYFFATTDTPIEEHLLAFLRGRLRGGGR